MAHLCTASHPQGFQHEVVGYQAYADPAPVYPIVLADEEHQFAQLNSQIALVLQVCGCPLLVLLNSEDQYPKKMEKAIESGPDAILNSHFLPSAEASKTICGHICDMIRADSDPRKDNYYSHCIKKHARSLAETIRKDGHLPCPSSWSLRIVSDWSGRLKAGTSLQ